MKIPTIGYIDDQHRRTDDDSLDLVSYNSLFNAWHAMVRSGDTILSLGMYSSAEAAADAIDLALEDVEDA